MPPSHQRFGGILLPAFRKTYPILVKSSSIIDDVDDV